MTLHAAGESAKADECYLDGKELTRLWVLTICYEDYAHVSEVQRAFSRPPAQLLQVLVIYACVLPALRPY